MDDLDRKIVDLMQRDGRLSNARLAERVGLSISAVNERLRKLQARGVITGYGARVDPAAFGLDLLAYVFVALEAPRFDVPFRAAMAATPDVLECHHVTGAWNHLLKLRAAGTADLERIMSTRISCIDGVARTETLVVLSSAKESWVLPTDRGNRPDSAPPDSAPPDSAPPDSAPPGAATAACFDPHTGEDRL